MADIRIRQLPNGSGPVATDFLAIDNGTTRRATIEDVVVIGRPTASQAEAEAGTDNVKAMTPLTTSQAVAFYGLTKAGNLSGLTNTTTARANLGLGSAAVESSSAFATAVQGGLADGAAQKSANLSDLDNPQTANQNLGDFPTEASFSAATIAAPVLFVTTAGYTNIGDGGGHVKKRISTPGAPQAWQKQSLDGAWWEIASSKIAPQMLGAVGDGVANDNTALTNAGNAAVALSRKLWLISGSTYLFTQWVIPDNCEIEAIGSVLRSDGALTVAADVTLTIGDNCIFDSIKLTTPGTETNTDIMSILTQVTGDYIEIVSDTQRAGGGIIIDPDHVTIGGIRTRKIDRPVHLWNQSTAYRKTGSRIGFVDCEDRVRAVRGTHCDFTIGPIHAVGRSPNASKSPGHNDILVVDCVEWNSGDLWSEDCGEHPVRIGGSTSNNNLFPFSENVAAWTDISNTTVTSNVTTAPDGTLTADRIAKAGVDGVNAPGNNVTVTNVVHTFSTYVKYGGTGSGWVRIRCSAPSNSFWVNAQTGEIGTINSGWSGVAVTAVGSGWYRVSGIITPTAGSVRWCVIPVTANNSGTADTGAVDNWGVKLELGSEASVYKPGVTKYSIGNIYAIRPGGCPLKINPTLKTTITGTVATSSGSATLTGTGTSFTADLRVGSNIRVVDTTEVFRVMAIASDTSLTLDRNAGSTDASSTLEAMEAASNGTVASVTGVDVGDPADAGNEELVRLSHIRGLRIGPCVSFRDGDAVSSQFLLQVNDIDDVDIASLGGEGVNAGFINFDGTSDVDGSNQFGGDVTRLRIGRLHGSCNGNNAIAVNMAFRLGKISIGLDNISGWTTNLVRWDAGTLTDTFELNGRVSGSVVPAYLTVPDNDFFLINVAYNNSRTIGRPNGSRAGAAICEFMSGVFSTANAAPTGLFVNATRATAGAGAYGAALELSRPGSSRRGAALVAKQITATAYQCGVAFMVANPGVVGNDALLEGGSLDHEGKMNVIGEYQVDGTKVVGNRVTGWTAATGTATRTTFATGTVTTAQLAERVKALIDDLIAHGMIGA